MIVLATLWRIIKVGDRPVAKKPVERAWSWSHGDPELRQQREAEKNGT